MKKYDEFDEPRGSGLGFLGNVGPKAAFFIVLIALSFMIGVVWKLYVGGGSTPAGQEVPIVRADDNPFKVTPDDPGGMEIPHKDSTIFSSLNNEEGARVENLLADSDDEEPMPRSQLFAGLNTDGDMPAVDEELGEGSDRIVEMTAEAENIVEDMIDDGVESVMPAPPESILDGEITDEATKAVTNMDALDLSVPEKVEPVLAPVTEAKPEIKVEPVKVEVKPEPRPEPKPEPKPAVTSVPKATPAPVSAPAPAAGDYYVQVGSVRSRDGAEGEWKKIVSKHSALSGFKHRVQAADLGAKGTFYRIQAGPVSKSAADSACAAIKRKDPSGCLVKKK